MRTSLPATLAALLLLAGCSLTPPASPPPTAAERRLAELERGRDPQAVIDYVESVVDSVPRTRRATFELARARALSATGLRRSALSAYQAAYNGLGGRNDPLRATVLEEWGDAEVRVGQPGIALTRYERALAAGAPADRVRASMVVAAEAAGRREVAAEARARLGRRADGAVASARQRLAVPGADRTRAVAQKPSPAASRPADVLAGVHSRSDWGARPMGANRDPMDPVKAITVHHSAMDAPLPGGTSAQLRRIQDDHMTTRAWADIGYHFAIDPAGEVWEARSLAWQGAHAGGSANVGNIGVCLLGNFDDGAVPSAQLGSLERLLDSLRDRYGVPAAAVRTHREWKATECPGRYLQAAVESYRSRSATLARQ